MSWRKCQTVSNVSCLWVSRRSCVELAPAEAGSSRTRHWQPFYTIYIPFPWSRRILGSWNLGAPPFGICVLKISFLSVARFFFLSSLAHRRPFSLRTFFRPTTERRASRYVPYGSVAEIKKINISIRGRADGRPYRYTYIFKTSEEKDSSIFLEARGDFSTRRTFIFMDWGLSLSENRRQKTIAGEFFSGSLNRASDR